MSHRRLRHLPFSLGSGTTGAKLVLYAPAMRGYADGDRVGTWADLSGNGYDVTAIGSARPLFGKLRGASSIVFSSTKSLERATGPTPSEVTVISAVNPTSWNSGQSSVIGAIGYDANPNIKGLCFGMAAHPYSYLDWMAGDALTFGSGYEGNPRAIGPCASGTDPRIISVKLGSSSRCWSNGERQSTRVESVGTMTYSGASLIIGGTKPYFEQWSGHIAAVVLFGSIISDSLRQRIQQSSGFTFRIATK